MSVLGTIQIGLAREARNRSVDENRTIFVIDVGCSVFEEHPRDRIDDESEACTMNRMTQRQQNLDQQRIRHKRTHQTPNALASY